MPKVSGKNLISETTEKVLNRALIVATVAVLTKLYNVPFNDLKALGMDLPAALVDTALLGLVLYYLYSLFVNWLFDIAVFRLWYTEASIWSQFGTNLKIDKAFLQGAVPLLVRLHTLEALGNFPISKDEIADKDRKALKDFELNAKLYTARLKGAGTRFSTLTWLARYYVWVQSLLFPVSWSCFAVYLLIRYGTFSLPERF